MISDSFSLLRGGPVYRLMHWFGALRPNVPTRWLVLTLIVFVSFVPLMVREDRQGGVTLMVMTATLDAGPIVRRWPVPLTGRETTPELEAALADLAADVVPPELDRWASGSVDQEPQDEAAATYVHPFTRGDGWIDCARYTAETLAKGQKLSNSLSVLFQYLYGKITQ